MNPPGDTPAIAREDVLPVHGSLDRHRDTRPHDVACRFLTDGGEGEIVLDYHELSEQSHALAGGLAEHDVAGKPVLLIQPTGPEFIIGLFACWHAGAIAVPAYPPHGSRHRARLYAILADSGARHAIAQPNLPPLPGVTMLGATGDPLEDSLIDASRICLLQYTSGSTASPKGVMMSHRHFRCHLDTTRQYLSPLAVHSAVSWLPPYHDMGLVLKILHCIDAGIPLTFFAADHFLQRPARWLRAIGKYRAELSGAPNFAFDLCTRTIRDEEMEGVDLSCWKAAPCGAERVRAETLDKFARRFEKFGFRREAFMPGYGLAEATLTVTVCAAGTAPRISKDGHVSCGKPIKGTRVRIADPVTDFTLADGEVGEIRVQGPAVADGYWRNDELTIARFGDRHDRELRTGDLGYFENGDLHITGRIKDLIIIDGVNHSAEDIEETLLRAVPEITATAAFSEEDGTMESVTIAIEARDIGIDRRAQLCGEAVRILGETAEIPVHRMVLVKSGLLPRTTSGKIRRSACREALADGSLKLQHDTKNAARISRDPDNVASLLVIIAEITGRKPPALADDAASLGISSLEATRILARARARLGIELSMARFFAIRSFSELAGEMNYDVSRSNFQPEASGDTLAMTHSQERMWFLHQLDPESPAYHVFGALDLNGPLDRNALDRAFDQIVSRHEILRSRHGMKNGRPEISIDDLRLASIDQRSSTPSEIEDALKNFAREPFDLADSPPLRACLFATGHHRHTLAICIHHIAADGFSMRVLVSELASFYSSYPLPPPQSGFLAYATRHRRWIESGAVDTQVAYWKSRLEGHPGVINLATDFPRPSVASSRGSCVDRVMSEDMRERVAAFATSLRATPFMVHLAAFFLLLRQHGAGDDTVIAVPVANRNHADADTIIGTLVNTLPFRIAADPRQTFTTLVTDIRDAAFEMQAAQDAPFERIIEAVQPERDLNRPPLAQVMFDYQEIPLPVDWTNDLKCQPHITHRGASQFDLSMLLLEIGDTLRVSIEFRDELFLPETIRSMLERHFATLEKALANPGDPVVGIRDLSDSERRWLDQNGQGPARPDFPARPVPEWISWRTSRHPLRTAVHAADGSLDYATLERRSDSLAARLQQAGVAHGDRVGVLLERGMNLPAALLAVWKAGAAYVPLDPMNPKERLALILKDQSPLKILVSPGLEDHLPEDAEIVFLDPVDLEQQDIARTARPLSPSDTAYIIHTSGSTGVPKGVVISHGALSNFLLSMAESPGFTEADRLLAVTTVSFDISLLEIFLPLVSGGCVDICPSLMGRDGVALAWHLQATRPTVMQATPSTWRMLMDAGWRGSPDLKILCGGEAMDLPLATRLVKTGCELWNLYGPTETTVWSTLWRVPENPTQILIGLPVANTGIHIVAEDGSPTPPGVVGELWISGAGLADGYWNRPQLNAERFVQTDEGGFYRTGDLARWHLEGTLECLGRSDGQVKIRGFRVELGEIECALVSHPDIAQAKVALRGGCGESGKLIAWVILRNLHDPFIEKSLRSHLAEHLPPFMIPSIIGVIDAFPLNASGKVDVSRLSEPVTTPAVDAPMPETPTERKLAAIWSDLLDARIIHRDDDWFMIGGHSLLALRLFSAIHREFGTILPLSDIMKNSTLSQLAARIESRTMPQTS